MLIGVVELEFHLPAATSIKDKRRVIKSIIGQLQSRFHVTAAEVDFQELWQRAVIAAGYISNDGTQVQKVLNHVIRWVEGVHESELIRSEIHLFSPEED